MHHDLLRNCSRVRKEHFVNEIISGSDGLRMLEEDCLRDNHSLRRDKTALRAAAAPGRLSCKEAKSCPNDKIFCYTRDMSTDRGRAPHVSVTQFASREGVSRIRVLQLLAQQRIPGARKVGHHWIIPGNAAIARRAPGRPRKQPRAAVLLLRSLARRYVWWLSPGEALARPNFVATQVMEMGDFDDVLKLEAALGCEALVRALREAGAGRLSERSWIYWHHRLGMARRRVPPLPRRTLR